MKPWLKNSNIMNNYFYNKLNNKNYSQDFLASIEQFANNNKIQIYVLSNPLTDNKYLYSYQYAYIILTAKKKIKRISLFWEFVQWNES